MKRILLSLVAIATLSLSSFGQAPEGFKYQAVVRDAGNLILNNQAVGMQLTIQQGSVGGTAVYTETFTPTTNGYGLVNLEIGSGTLVSGDFTTIDWANGPFFMETAVDVTGGTSYAVMGTSQLMSVPYALYAKTSGNGAGPQGPAGNDGIDGVDGAIGATGAQGPAGNDGVGIAQTLSQTGSDVTLSDGGGTVSVNDADADSTNELQNLSVSAAGDTLYLQNGGFVIIPGISAANAPPLAIGDTYQGGIIFYLDGLGGGLIAAPTDQSSGAEWGCQGTIISGADGIAIGTGAQNTIHIEFGCSTAGTAADLCANLVLSGYTDWFLPSKDELNLMYQNIGQGDALGLGNVGGFASNFYWSSTEDDNFNAWNQDFLNGVQFYSIKNYSNYVRSVRAF